MYVDYALACARVDDSAKTMIDIVNHMCICVCILRSQQVKEMMRIQAYAETQKGRTFVALSLYEAVSHNYNYFLIQLST